jgi:DNA helicase HerA-like ATPase
MVPLDGDLVPAAKASTGLTTVAGRALDWHEPGWGKFIEDSPHSFATREITSIAGSDEIGDLGMPTLWQGMHSVAAAMLSGAAFMPGCDAIELRYVIEPAIGQASRVRMYVTAKAHNWYSGPAEAAVEAACAALPRGFVYQHPERDFTIGQTGPNRPIIELRRLEEVTEPHWEYIEAKYYYTINDDPGDGSGWQRFGAVLAQTSRPVEISILYKSTDLHYDERNLLASLTSDLAVAAEPHVDYDIMGNQEFLPGDTNARVALESWTKRISQLQRPLLARLAVRADYDIGGAIATALATAIASRATPDGNHPMYPELAQTPVDERQAAYGFDYLEIFPWGGHPIWDQSTLPDGIAPPHMLRRLAYMFGLQEAASLAILPVPDRQGVPGFPRARRLAQRRAYTTEDSDAGPSVALGSIMHHGQPTVPLRLPLKAVNRHVLTVGASGSGKTTTVLTLLAELWREHQIPFLAIEPSKTEYRSLMTVPGLESLRVISLGRDDISPLRLNPLAPPPGVRRENHAGAVLAALKLALPLFPPLPQLLDEAIDHAYERAGWDYDTTLADGLTPPTLRALLDSFEVVFEKQGFRGDALSMAASVRLRLNSLLQGSRGRVLDTVESTDFAELLSGPVVVELNEIQDNDEKAVLAAFVLDRVQAAARQRGSAAGQLLHVTVLEEAHRLLSKADAGAGNALGGDNTKAQTVRAFCEAIAELRSTGEGWIISSQRPAALADDAVANTGTRIIHRLETASDRQGLLDDLDASPLEREAAARLSEGEAVMRWPQRDEPEIVQVTPGAGVDTGHRVKDETVRVHMSSYAAETRRLLPYAMCTREVCLSGCDPARRKEGDLIAKDLSAEARGVWEKSEGNIKASTIITKALAIEADGQVDLAYCGAVHLSVRGDAFKRKRRRDIRQQVADLIRDAVRDGDA